MAGTADSLLPILTFHSVLDFTVSTRAAVNAVAPVCRPMAALVLFDLEPRHQLLGLLFRRGVDWPPRGACPAEPLQLSPHHRDQRLYRTLCEMV